MSTTRVHHVQTALSGLPRQITRYASGATSQVEVVRMAVEEEGGRWTVRVALVPIGEADWTPAGLELVLLPDGEMTGEAAAVSPRLWTARWEDVEAGEYRIIAREPQESDEDLRESLRRQAAKPSPTGKRGVDGIAGEWPGDESDEEIEEALDGEDPHAGMMTRREVLEFIVEVFMSPGCASIDDEHDQGWIQGMGTVLGYSYPTAQIATHELALIMDAEREDSDE